MLGIAGEVLSPTGNNEGGEIAGGNALCLLVLDSGRGVGGSARFAYYFLTNLDRQKFTPELGFYGTHDSDEIQHITKAGIPVRFFPPHALKTAPRWRLLGSRNRRAARLTSYVDDLWQLIAVYRPSAWSLYKYLRERRPAIVLLNSDIHYHIPAAIACTLTGVPLVCRKAGGVGEQRRLRRLLAKCVHTFVTVSKDTEADQLRTSPASRVVSINEGIDAEDVAPMQESAGVRTKLGIPQGVKVVAGAARFRPGKGQLVFVRAAAEVIKSYGDVRFMLLGTESPGQSEYMRTVRKEVSNLGLEGKVIFPGWVPTTSEILSCVDVFVHCPTAEWQEAVGIANLEAMSAGIPTVVSNNGGLAEVVVDQLTGFVTPQNDHAATAHSILRLLREPDLARRMGAAGRRRVEEQFNIALNNKQFESLLEEVGGESRPRIIRHGLWMGAAAVMTIALLATALSLLAHVNSYRVHNWWNRLTHSTSHHAANQSDAPAETIRR